MKEIEKSMTGIAGLDEITYGGLPKGRPTLLCGNAGCGKTVIAMEFLVNGAVEFNEPGVFMSFEERVEDLEKNYASFGWDLNRLTAEKKLSLSYVHIERNEIEETGDYDLEGLFVRLGQAIDSVKAKRVVLDTVEALFSGFSNTAILRAELRRLFQWLKDKGVTAVITAERGLFLSFEESAAQLINNMKSIGLDLDASVKKGLLTIQAKRPTVYGLETHLVKIHGWIEEFNPTVVVIDPMTSLASAGVQIDVALMFTRLIDFLKTKQITFFFTALTGMNDVLEAPLGVSSIVDTLISLSRVKTSEGLSHEIAVIKSRGTAHTIKSRRLSFTSKGIRLTEGGPLEVASNGAK